MNKLETKKIVDKIFNYIDNGEVKTEYNTFKGHPGLYFFHTKEEFEKILNLYLQKEEYDRYDIYYIVQRLIKFLLDKYDSHTRMWFQDDVVFPIKFKIENNKVYVINVAEDLENIIGGELVSINNISIKQIINELEQIICYSTEEHLETTISNYLTHFNILKSLPSIDNNITKANYKILYNGVEKNIIFDESKKYNNYQDNIKENCTYEIKDDILIIYYNSCKNRDKMNKLVEEIKQEKNINYYIVDIRNNSGGDSSIIDPLIEFLTDKEVITLVNEKVFSSGMMAMMDLKRIGSYTIGTNVGTSLNYFGETPDKFDLNNLGLSIKRSNRYWYYDEDLNCKSFTKGKFEEYFKDKKELLEPIIFKPDKFVDLTVKDIISGNDVQLNSAIEYIKNQ